MTGRSEIRSTCPYCGVGCGVLLSPEGEGGLAVRGDPEHPANRGRLCSKGLALGETVGDDGRLLAPQVDGAPAGWDDALDLVARRFSETIEAHGPDSVAFYVSGQLLTEDYYVANKLMKGFIGSGNIDTNSRLCMASTVAGQKRAFGTDTVPGTYDDLEEADLVVLVGSNLAWCHPVLYQRLVAARKARGTKVVVVDPRRTATCDIADLHLRIRPGTDVALFNGLLLHLWEVGALDEQFVRTHTEGFEAALSRASGSDPAATGLTRPELAEFFSLFARTERAVTVFSQGVNQSSQGTDKVNAILNCHLATGRIGKPGMGPFSVTGQPNAMGGRETGGLANMLAAHLDIEDARHRSVVRDFWAAPRLTETAGLKAVDIFRAAGDGRIKALWIACTNPAVSMPGADEVAAAIRACEFVVVSDMFADTDTARLADVVLPATGWGEKDGTVTNSDRTISRQRAALAAPGQARPDWAIFADVARRMGWADAFDYCKPAEVFREHAALSGLAGALGRDFDISALADISDGDYDALAPARWPLSATRTGGRFFGDGAFFTPSGRARFVAVEQGDFAALRSPRFPYRLNTGRNRDQWHTMTRTALAARLSRHLAEPYLQIHPGDAARLGLAPADLAEVSGPDGGRAILRVLVSADVAEGAPFAPFHWTGETAAAARIGPLISAATDPVSGQPESKGAVVAISKFPAAWHGFAVSAAPLTPEARYWARVRSETGWRAELADTEEVTDWTGYARALFGLTGDPQIVTDAARSEIRLAFRDGDRLAAALFIAPGPVSVARDFVVGRIGEPGEDLLAARPGAGRIDPGPTVCSCMNVGRNTILAAAADLGADLKGVCAATGAGTNCGSCRPEIADLIQRFVPREAAE
ncbi:nitrate reductase [Jannaschia aquimarina]|uniref:NasA_2 protein n=1 Tax=Jannaschia aquimarina TaxID=935700 RepID=A0A0D1D4R0_9RHOB|nr:nitrate reductase [Jannaschia aquimarina]KIT15058.1 Nitrate reductase [Jannaschia aquimarina]SNS63012.1 assimilatory nitrate reductase (NADH) alpha subunit apoprotein [Jannaschia aquimarina]